MLKDSIGHLTDDPRLQALLIAFAFGAFIEGAAGFGTPVAVAAAMLDRSRLLALLRRRHLPARQHRPGGLRLHRHSHHDAGRHHRPAPRPLERRRGPHLRAGLLVVPAYLILVMSGWGAARRAARGRAVRRRLRRHAVPDVQFRGPAAHRHPGVAGRHGRAADRRSTPQAVTGRVAPHGRARSRLAWAPYGLLVIFVLLWGYKPSRSLSSQRPRDWPAAQPELRTCRRWSEAHALSAVTNSAGCRPRARPACSRRFWAPWWRD